MSTRLPLVSASIAFLSEDLASQIAAGEVVERPASVVKELIENALDAGATRVDVTIEGGGVARIEVSDDGVGMKQEDALLCLGRHATSKLRSINDLEEIRSFGFRGEALPSVASVSRLTLRTRFRDEEGGVLLTAEGTTKATSAPIGAPVGTTLEVRDLFFNVPARRKFLRSSNTESGHITEVVVDCALGRHDVSFTLTRDGRKTKNFPRVLTRADRVAQVLSEETLFRALGERGPLRMEAFLSPPERARKGAVGLRIFVNGRPVRDRALAATVAHAYGESISRGTYPRGVIHLELPGRLVDVNVHPQKSEVRFAEPRAVADAVHSIIKRELVKAEVLTPSRPEVASDGPLDQRAPTQNSEARGPRARRAQVLRQERSPISGQRYGWDTSSSQAPSSPAQPPAPRGASAGPASGRRASAPSFASEPPPAKARSNWKNLRLLGQAKRGFLICEGEDGIYVLDQHAAHERVLLTQLKRAWEASQVSNQALLFPVVVEVSAAESEQIAQRAHVFTRLGLDVRVRSDHSVSLHSIPQILARSRPEDLLKDVCSVLSSSKAQDGVEIDSILGRLACAEALKPGDRVQHETGDILLRSLSVADFELPCPHGRVIVGALAVSELEKKAGRES